MSLKTIIKYSKLGFFYIFSSEFFDETKDSSIDFFKREDTLLSSEMKKYLEKESNKKEYIKKNILKKEEELETV